MYSESLTLVASWCGRSLVTELTGCRTDPRPAPAHDSSTNWSVISFTSMNWTHHWKECREDPRVVLTSFRPLSLALGYVCRGAFAAFWGCCRLLPSLKEWCRGWRQRERQKGRETQEGCELQEKTRYRRGGGGIRIRKNNRFISSFGHGFIDKK